MRAEARFSDQTISFWAYVRAITEATGYSLRGSNKVSTITVAQMIDSLKVMDRPSDHLGTKDSPSVFALALEDYFDYRASVLNHHVKNDLMITSEAAATFAEVKASVGVSQEHEVSGWRTIDGERIQQVVAMEYKIGNQFIRVPMNKQKNEKRNVSYLTGMVNLLIAYHLGGRDCDYDPRKIPVIDHEGTLYAALSRRMDGSFPSTKNPIAMWEVKEYYYTTTFGSKISDAVYITSLDGYERREVERETATKIEHLVIVDAFDTWWGKGKSYLCRMIDVLNMGHVDEILFGREVVRRLPEIVPIWVNRHSLEPSDDALLTPLNQDE